VEGPGAGRRLQHFCANLSYTRRQPLRSRESKCNNFWFLAGRSSASLETMSYFHPSALCICRRRS
jgi:hypothetical protein